MAIAITSPPPTSYIHPSQISMIIAVRATIGQTLAYFGFLYNCISLYSSAFMHTPIKRVLRHINAATPKSHQSSVNASCTFRKHGDTMQQTSQWLPERKRGQYKLFAAEIAHPCIPEEYTNFVLWLVFISLLLSSISRTEPCHANTTYSQNYACSHAIHLPGLRNKRATAIRRFREYHTQCGLFIHAMAVPSLASHELRIPTR